jgi:8-oxo-dGTP pyrophosphatase MutT (NUDIX family)
MLLWSMSSKGRFDVVRWAGSPWLWPVVVVVAAALAGQIGPVWALSAAAVTTLGLGGSLILAGRIKEPSPLTSGPVTTPEQLAIRPLALGLIRNSDRILVFEGHDDVKGETFYRLLGGGIEFGEQAVEALHREFVEELGAELTNAVELGVLENIFTVNGRAGHEIVYVFEATLADPSWYEREDLGTILDEGSPVSWLLVSEFVSGERILYPSGLVERLRDGGAWAAPSGGVDCER